MAIVGRVSSLQNPSGVVFDPVNQVFLTVNSLVNNIVITNPATLTSSNVSVGIAPTSVDYDFQTSSLVTVNAGSHVMSVLDYACPPTVPAPACSVPQVRAVLGLGGAQTSSLVLGPNAVAIDPKLGLAVLVDPDNNRVLACSAAALRRPSRACGQPSLGAAHRNVLASGRREFCWSRPRSIQRVALRTALTESD